MLSWQTLPQFPESQTIPPGRHHIAGSLIVITTVSIGLFHLGCSTEGSTVGLKDWTRTRLSSWPSRVFTIAAGDLNSGVGTFRDGTKADCASVGEFHNASQNEAGDNFVEMSMSLELGFLNTLWRTGGPAYCGLAGHRSTIDHILVPLSGSECVKKVVTCWKLGRKLQLIPAAHPRDQLPVLVLLALRMRRVGHTQQRTRWDF